MKAIEVPFSTMFFVNIFFQVLKIDSNNVFYVLVSAFVGNNPMWSYLS